MGRWILVLISACRFHFDVLGDDSIGDGSVAGFRTTFIKATNADPSDEFGFGVALSGDGNTLAVGASYESSGSAATPADNTVFRSGAVYVYTRNGSTWMPQAYLKAAYPDGDDYFGWQLALSDDGNTLAVGAFGEDSGNPLDERDTTRPKSGAAYVFVRSGTVWSQQAFIKAPTIDSMDNFGVSLALSATGDTLAVGANQESSNATNVGGDQSNNLMAFSGAVYVYTRAGTTWSFQAYIKASNTGAGDEFGSALALSDDGNQLVVGAPMEDSLAAPSDNLAIDAGAAYVYTRSGTMWSPTAFLKGDSMTGGPSSGQRSRSPEMAA